MSFARDKARMKRVLRKCDAPPDVLSTFDDICRYRTTETAEELLLSVCRRHGFVAPYLRDDRMVTIRPYSLGQHHPNYHHDDSGRDPVAEQSYRRGYDQGADMIVQMMKEGKSLAQIEQHLATLHQWRTQPIQFLHASPGCTTPQELPEHWQHV
jgi:hypothetical protein